MLLEVPLPVAFAAKRGHILTSVPWTVHCLHDFTYGDQSQTLLSGVDCACGYGQEALGAVLVQKQLPGKKDFAHSADVHKEKSFCPKLHSQSWHSFFV